MVFLGICRDGASHSDKARFTAPSTAFGRLGENNLRPASQLKKMLSFFCALNSLSFVKPKACTWPRRGQGWRVRTCKLRDCVRRAVDVTHESGAPLGPWLLPLRMGATRALRGLAWAQGGPKRSKRLMGARTRGWPSIKGTRAG